MTLLVFFLGLAWGSFMNVCIYRLPESQSIVSPPSHCPRCRHPIRWYDNMPLVSFVLLKGKCRDCKAAISWRYPLVELLVGAMALIALWKWGWTAYALAGFLILSSAVAVALIDFKYQIIPDEISLTGIVLGVVFSIFFPLWQGGASRLEGFWGSLIGLLAGGGFLYVAGTLGEWVFKKEAMGGGDVKLMAAVGAFLGWKVVLVTIFVGSFFGAGVGIFLRVLKGQERIPFGPYLVLGTITYLFLGETLISWYVSKVLGLY